MARRRRGHASTPLADRRLVQGTLAGRVNHQSEREDHVLQRRWMTHPVSLAGASTNVECH